MEFKERPCNATDCDNWLGKSELCVRCMEEKFIFETDIYMDEPDEGFYDEVGGYHDSAIGWNPQGVWCGECCSVTCKGCVNEFKKE